MADVSVASTGPMDPPPFQMQEIFPNVFLSSRPSSIPDNITHTINLSPSPPARRANGDELSNHLAAPISPDGSITDHLPNIVEFIREAVPVIRLDLDPTNLPPQIATPNPPTNNILLYSQDGTNRAPAAIIAHLSAVLRINVVEAFFIMKERKKDISVSMKLLEQIQDFLLVGEFYEDVGKEIARRVREGKGFQKIKKEKSFKEVMKKAESEDWMFEGGE